MDAIQIRLRDAVQHVDVAAVERVDREVRNVVAHAVSHDSARAVLVLEALKDLYTDLIAAVAAERSRLGDELKALGNGRRGVSAYQDAPDA